MRVLVLNPPFRTRFNRSGRWHAIPRGMSLWYPKWLAYTVGVLEREGHEVDFVDAPADNLSLPDLGERARRFQPQLIVCDTSTPGFSYEAKAASYLKQCVRASIVLVGTHVSALPELSLKMTPDADFVAVGEYDYTVAELAKVLDGNGDVANVKGLVHRQGERVIHNELRPFIEDLDSLPFATEVYEKHLDIRKYSLDFTLYPYVDIVTGRGCPYHCIYCLWPQVLMGHKYRVRSLDNIFCEIDQVLSSIGYVKEIMLDDDTFTADHNRVREFCTRILNERYHFTWSLNCRADITDKELIDLMAEAGCRLVVVGYESGSQEILNNSKKGTKLENMPKFTRLCKAAGIKIHGDFMLGLPGETEETIHQTIKLAKKLSPDTFQISIATPYPGTELYRWLKGNGYLHTESFDEWLDEGGQQRCMFGYPNLSQEQMERALKRAVTGYYLRPGYIFRTFTKALRDRREFQRYLIAARGFAKQLWRWYILRQ